MRGNIFFNDNVCSGLYTGQIPASVLQNGVSDADLVIVVSAEKALNFATQTIEVCQGSTLAAAYPCVLDQFDRPVVGYTNFCLDNLGILNGPTFNNWLRAPLVNNPPVLLTQRGVDNIISTTLHETGHVLGMVIDMFRFFRDPETGDFQTPRPFESTQVWCPDGTTRSVLLPSTRTLQWELSPRGVRHYHVVTPRVRTVVRNHFNCQSLQGARIENLPTLGSCIGSHWDERLFYSELLGPALSGVADPLSPLTLALLEDSGWYRVNYTGSTASPYGHAAGCEFVNNDCIVNNQVPSYGAGAFCDTPTEISPFGGIVPLSNPIYCDPNHIELALCDLFDTDALPPSSTINSGPNTVRYFDNHPSWISIFQLTDQCPLPQITLGLDCTDPMAYTLANDPFRKTYQGEESGPSSRCINADPNDGSPARAGCFPIECDAAAFRVRIAGQECRFDGEELSVGLTNGNSFGKVICPPLAVVCPDLYCPVACSGRGVCNYDATPPRCECYNPDDNSPACNGSPPRSFPQQPSPSATPSPSTGKSQATGLLLYVAMVTTATVLLW